MYTDDIVMEIVDLIKQLSAIRGKRLTLDEILAEFEMQRNP